MFYMSDSKKKKLTGFQNILKDLKIDETFTKADTNKKEGFNTIKGNVPPVEDYNMMADLLQLPKAQFGFQYLFVICDLSGNGHFDIEPLKTKTPEACLKAMEKCFQRKYIKNLMPV